MTFNAQHPFHDRAHIIDRNGQIVHGPHFGLSLRDGLDLVRLSLTPEALLDGRRIEEFFPPISSQTEFWLLWSTHHGVAAAARRDRVPALHQPRPAACSPTSRTCRTSGVRRSASTRRSSNPWPPGCRRKRRERCRPAPSCATSALAPAPDRITVERLECERDGAVGLGRGRAGGHRAADHRVAGGGPLGRVDDRAAAAAAPGSSTWALWQRLAKDRPGFGDPEVFFGDAVVPDSRWVSFTVTTTGTSSSTR